MTDAPRALPRQPFFARHRVAVAQSVVTGSLLAAVLWSGCGKGGEVDGIATGMDAGIDAAVPTGSAGSGGGSGAPGSAGSAGGGGAGATFRAVFLADTHVIGPQYQCCSENSPADNSSIVKTAARLMAVRDLIASMDPPPAMAFVLGDIVHAAYWSHDLAWYHQNDNAFSVARDILETFPVPVHMVLGNHDYGVDCDQKDDYDRAFTHSLFQDFFGAKPYDAVDFGGWKFLLTNGQLGQTWDSSDPKCSNDIASMGVEQMKWADAQLNEGKPTLVMSHYMRILHQGDEQGGPYGGLPALLDAHDNVQAFLAGHTHRWLDLTKLNNDVFHHVLGATRYDSDNFWLVEFDQNASTFRVLDQNKQRIGNSCADTWTYQGTPKPVDAAPETGDCVSTE